MTLTITNFVVYSIVAVVFTLWQTAPDRIQKAIFAFLFMLMFLLVIKGFR